MGSQYSSKRESFHDAILKKDLKKVKYFIQNGLDVKNDLRALELATYRGSTDIVEYLLHRGCKPNNKRTARAFDIAVWKCHKEIAQLFLKAGIEYKGKNIYQETILFVAACSNNIALTEILIESGCDMNETTRHWSPLHAAAARNHVATLETLLKHGCSVDIPDKDGLTALAYCIRNENIQCIKLLIKCGCKIDMNIINSTECLRNQLIKYPLIEQLLYEEKVTVKSLMELSRLKIRKCLDQRLISKCNTLPLPQKLKDYICMKDLFSQSNNARNVACSKENDDDEITTNNINNYDVINTNNITFSSMDDTQKSNILSSQYSSLVIGENGDSFLGSSSSGDNTKDSRLHIASHNHNLMIKKNVFNSNASSFSSTSSSSSSSSSSASSASSSSSVPMPPSPLLSPLSKATLDMCTSKSEASKTKSTDTTPFVKKTSFLRQATKKLGLEKKFRNEM